MIPCATILANDCYACILIEKYVVVFSVAGRARQEMPMKCGSRRKGVDGVMRKMV
jgi:hypothetical protein